jgi:hypothetical protein
MLKRILPKVLFAMLLLSTLVMIQFVKAVPTTWIVDDDGPADFTSIQDAIDVASPGDTIYVKAGTYAGFGIGQQYPWKDGLSIVGEDNERTIINGDGSGTGVLIMHHGYDILVTSFTVRNWETGVYVGTTNGPPQNITIEDCIIADNDVGIQIQCDHPHYPAHFPWGGFDNVEDYEDVFGTRIGPIVIHQNRFINNIEDATDDHPEMHDWHHPTRLEGNYWDEYPGVDDGSGGRVAGDGIGDTDIPWPEPNYDNYPRMYPLASIPVSVKLTGELDYLQFENIKIRLAALVTDDNTGAPVSDADVTLDIYNAEGGLLVSASMIENLVGTGIYEWESPQTIRRLMRNGQINKGVYLAHARASFNGGPIAADILEFHIDPPGEDVVPLTLIIAIIALLISIVTPLVLFRQHIKRLFQSKRVHA